MYSDVFVLARSALRRASSVAGLAALLGAVGQVEAAGPCPLSLRSGGPVTIDGAAGAGEWDDAVATRSGGACLDSLSDLDTSTGTTIQGQLAVYSKRYTSGGVTFLGFMFEVQDHTSNAPGGERIVLQLDPNLSGGNSLASGAGAAADYKVEVVHHWHSSASDPALVDDVTVQVFAGGTQGLCPAGSQHWIDVTSTVSPGSMPLAKVRKDLVTGGYRAEIAVPVTLIGSPGGDIGIAFAVVNDTGSNCTGVGCQAYGAGFPSALLIQNGDEAIGSDCSTSWTKPSQWATGYASAPPVDVYFSHSPAYWNSEDIDALRCNSVVDNSWYQSHPCKLAVRAQLRNSSSSSQTRNVLYLWGKPGMGQTQWYFLDLKKDVQITGATLVQDSQLSSINLSLSEHPCVRAYILPPGFRPDFPEDRMRGTNSGGILSDGDLNAMVTAYALQGQHSAQQNMTLALNQVCTDASCLASTSDPSPMSLFAELDAGRSFAAVANAAVLAALIPEANAQATTEGQGAMPPAPKSGQSSAGRQVLVPGRRLEQFQRDHLLVQIRAFAYRAVPSQSKAPYNFVEEIAGIVKLVPVSQLKESKSIAFDFEVGNPAQVERVVFLEVSRRAPSGYEDIPVKVDTTPKVYRAGETRMVSATVGAGCGCSDLKCLFGKLASNDGGGRVPYVAAVFGLASIGAIAFWRRRKDG